MCKYLILLLLSFDGEVIKEKYEFARPMNLYECMDFGSDHREQIATYDWSLCKKQKNWQSANCKIWCERYAN